MNITLMTFCGGFREDDCTIHLSAHTHVLVRTLRAWTHTPTRTRVLPDMHKKARTHAGTRLISYGPRLKHSLQCGYFFRETHPVIK